MNRIVICGSLKFKEEIYSLKKDLELLGYEVLAPIDIDIKDKIEKGKYKLIHFNKIGDKNTDAIIVLNKEKNSIANYIGPSSFAEIAVAFYCNKKIFLLNDIYDIYRDELETWGCICLNGDLSKIKNVFPK